MPIKRDMTQDLFEAGFEIVGAPKSSQDKTDMRCLLCGNVASKTPSSTCYMYRKTGKRGCPLCTKKAVMEEKDCGGKNLEYFRSRGLVPLDGWNGTIRKVGERKNTTVRWKNANCGHEFSMTAFALKYADYDCPVCEQAHRASEAELERLEIEEHNRALKSAAVKAAKNIDEESVLTKLIRNSKLPLEIVKKLSNRDWLNEQLNAPPGKSRVQLGRELNVQYNTINAWVKAHNISLVYTQQELNRSTRSGFSGERKKQILDKRYDTNQRLYGVDNAFALVGINDDQQNSKAEKRTNVSERLSDVARERQNKEREVAKRLYTKRPPSITALEALNLLYDKEQLKEIFETKRCHKSYVESMLGITSEMVDLILEKYGIEYNPKSIRSFPEQEVNAFIESLGFSTVQGSRNILKDSRKEIDILVPNAGVAVEFNGIHWHSDANASITEHYHQDKWVACNEVDYRLVSVYEDEWRDNPDLVKATLKNILQPTTCHQSMRLIDVDVASSFFKTYDVLKSVPGEVNFGFYRDDTTLVGVASGKMAEGNFVVTNYCQTHAIQWDHLIKYCRSQKHKGVIVCSDLRWQDHQSLIDDYGFSFVRVTEPQPKVVIYSSTYYEAELEPAELEKYPRIWDCGHSIVRFRFC